MSLTGNNAYSITNPGDFKWSVDILQKTGRDNIDENGFAVVGWDTVYSKLRCDRSDVTTSLGMLYSKDNPKKTIKFTTRKRNIDASMFIKFKNKIYDIQDVNEVDDFFLEILANEYLGG